MQLSKTERFLHTSRNTTPHLNSLFLLSPLEPRQSLHFSLSIKWNAKIYFRILQKLGVFCFARISISDKSHVVKIVLKFSTICWDLEFLSAGKNSAFKFFVLHFENNDIFISFFLIPTFDRKKRRRSEKWFRILLSAVYFELQAYRHFFDKFIHWIDYWLRAYSWKSKLPFIRMILFNKFIL